MAYEDDWSPRTPRTHQSPWTPRTPRTPHASPRNFGEKGSPTLQGNASGARRQPRKYAPSVSSSLSSVTLDEADSEQYLMPTPIPPRHGRAPLHRAIDRVSRFFTTVPEWVRPPFQHHPMETPGPTQPPEPVQTATHRCVFSQAFSACCCTLASLLELTGFILNQVMIVHLPAYSQGTLKQVATDIIVKLKDDVDAIPGSNWSSWSKTTLVHFLFAYMPIFAVVCCLAAAICQLWGESLRKELPNGMQAALSGSADRLYVGEHFPDRYGCCAIKLLFIPLLSIPVIIALITQLLIYTTTIQYLGDVNVIGKASTSSLGLSAVFTVIAVVLMFMGCCLSAYEQVWRIKLKDLKFSYDPPQSMTTQLPPAYASGSVPIESPFLHPASGFSLPPETPTQFDSMRSPRMRQMRSPAPISPRHTVKRARQPPRRPKSEYSEDSYASSAKSPPQAVEAYAAWGAPLQR